MRPTTRTHCVVCVRCQYVSTPCSLRAAWSALERLNNANTCHEAIAVTVAEASVISLLFNDDELEELTR